MRSRRRRFRCHSEGAALFCLSFSLLLPASGAAQPVDRAPLGWDVAPALLPGQEVQRVLCPPRSYLVGFRQVLGYWLYQASPVCAPIDPEGSWVDGPHWTQEGLVNLGGLGAHGITDFLVVSLTCPWDSFAFGFTGVIVRARDESAGETVFRMPGMVRPVCHKRSSPIDLSPTSSARDWRRPEDQAIPWASFEEPEFVGWRGFESPATCRPDEVAVGVWSVRDQWLRTIGLVCDSFERMRPRTPVEVGAADLVKQGFEVLGLDEVPPGAGLRPGVAEKADWTKARSAPGRVERPSSHSGLELQPPRGSLDKAPVGETSQGKRVRTECPPRAAITSLWTVGDDRSLQSVQIWCTSVDSRGAWAGPPQKPLRGAVMLSKGFAIDDDSVFDRLRKMPCPAGSFLVGVNPGVSRVGDRLAPWQAVAECRRPQDGAVSEVASPAPASFDENHFLLGWDGAGGPRSCASDEVGVGVWGTVSPDYVESFGLVCAPWQEVQPRSAAELGADEVPSPLDPSKTQGAAERLLRERVPEGASYVLVNEHGRKLREFRSGEATGMGPACVQVACPTPIVREALGKQLTCWRCRQD